MISYIDYQINKDNKGVISKWHYGINWPVVYVYYNSNKAYIGETLDALRRTEEHEKETQFDEFTNICFFSGKTYNKSVILDLEALLIKYMSAAGEKILINGNVGVVDHNYFYKEAYEEDFKEIWNVLIEKGIVKKTLLSIENSELFKYSPYKSLNNEQQKAAHEILQKIYEINNASKESLIQVEGGAGTGKTILAVYLIKLLVDIRNHKEVWKPIDGEEAESIRHLVTKISGIHKIGFVVPMNELRKIMRDKIFSSIDGLSKDMVLAPEDVVDSMYDLLVVDEAHRLYQNKHLPQGAQGKFKKVNMKLMGDDYKNLPSDLTELDWIIRSSRIQVIFYDSKQSIRTPDIDEERFKNITKPHLAMYYELFSQMRCKGGNGYYEYVKKILRGENLQPKDHEKIKNYDLIVFDSFEEMNQKIDALNIDNLCKIVTGPAWSLNEDIIIDGEAYHWAGSSSENAIIYSIHKTQGFDLNYAGVVFGREIFYDKDKGCIEINKKALKDNFTKSSGDEKMRDYILDIYLTLMTRGIYGTYVYALDPALREYFKQFWN